MNAHNRDRLEDIEALIKESAALKSKMDGMAADKERIRSCCVQAIDDAVDTIEAVADLVRRGGFAAKLAYAGYWGYEICGTGGERFDLSYRDAGDISISDVCMVNPNGGGLYIMGKCPARALPGGENFNTRNANEYKKKVLDAESIGELNELREVARNTTRVCDGIIRILHDAVVHRIAGMRIQLDEFARPD